MLVPISFLGHDSKTDDMVVVGVSWAPFDTVDKAKKEDLLTNTWVKALRQLAPDMGAYINEVYIPPPPFYFDRSVH